METSPTKGLQAEIYCRLGLNVMTKPVIANDGFSYDEANIVRYFESTATPRSAVTNQPMKKTTLKENKSLRRVILCFMESYNGTEISKEEVCRYFLDSGRLYITENNSEGLRLLEIAKEKGSEEAACDIVALHVRKELQNLRANNKASFDLAFSNFKPFLLHIDQYIGPGTKLRMIDSIKKLRELCCKPAAGSRQSCGFTTLTSQMAGKVVEIIAFSSSHKGYVVKLPNEPDSRSVTVPFTALTPVGENDDEGVTRDLMPSFEEVARPSALLPRPATPSPITYTLNIVERCDIHTTQSTMTIVRRFTHLLAIKQWLIDTGKATFAAHISNNRVLLGDGITFEIDFEQNFLTSDDDLVPAMSTIIVTYPVESS